MPIAIAALLGLTGLLIVLYPLLGIDPAAEPANREALERVSEQEVSAKQSLRDVDFDRRLGNLDEDDYRDLRNRFEESALEAMKSRYERERELDLAIDRQLHALSAERPASHGIEKAARSASRVINHVGVAKPTTSSAPPTDSASNGAPAAATDAATHHGALRKRRGV